MIRFPKHLERQYQARLLRRLRAARSLVLERLRHPSRRGDQAGDPEPKPPPKLPTATIGAVRRAWQVALPLEPDSLLPAAQAVDAWATKQTAREVQKLVKVDVSKDARLAPRQTDHWKWARENVALIKTMEAETFDDLTDHVVRAVVEGRTDLAKVIQDRFGVAESRARLIARDQIAKLNGKITEDRQTALGIRSYEWSSSGDERVRPKHRALDGTVRKWSEPHPTEGHPGSSIACRCVAVPVLDDEIEAPEPEDEPAPALPSLPPTFGPPPPRLPSTFGGEPLRPPVFAPPPAVRMPPAVPGRPALPTTFEGEPLRPPVIVPPPAQATFRQPMALESPRRRAGPPGPTTPPALPPHPTPPAPPPARLHPVVEREVRNVEEQVRAEPEEHGAIVLPSGRRISLDPEHTHDHGRDAREVLVLPSSAMRAARLNPGAVLTHGHPSGMPFSSSDLEMAVHLDLAEIRATTPAGGAWVVRRPSDGWPDGKDVVDAMDEAMQDAEKRARLQMDDIVRAAGGDPRDGKNAKGWDESTWRQLADWHTEAGIRQGIDQAGLALEFEP